MAWEHIDIIFPTGYMTTATGVTLTNQDIINNQLQVVSSIRNYCSRGMFYKEEEWVWGANGEFAIITKFDALNLIPHVDGIAPLNVYGNMMVRQFLNEHNIVFDVEKDIENNNNNFCNENMEAT